MTNDAQRVRREHAIRIYGAAVGAVDPQRLVAGALRRRGEFIELRSPPTSAFRYALPLLVVGAGKGAARMAAACEELLGSEEVSGSVVVNDGAALGLRSIEVFEAGHPIPDERGVAAARRMLQRIETSAAPSVLALISGGASSLLVAPRAPVSLADKVETTRLLLRCGADISEINPVRKHLSEVKGGGLLRRARRPLLALIVSDVVGDDPSTVGSGPTVPDPTTFADAWSVLRRYDLVDKVPAAVRQLLGRGVAHAEAETVKPGSGDALTETHVVIGSNRLALEGAAAAARQLGWRVEIASQPLIGDTKVAARGLSAKLQAAASEPGLCFLAGGETTVEVKGPGRGGRNQEFALHLAEAVSGLDLSLLSAGTDGIDGPTDAAGAFVDGTTLARSMSRSMDPTSALTRNDSYAFFDRLGDLYRCGPTGTNVMDIKVALIGPPPVSGRS